MTTITADVSNPWQTHRFPVLVPARRLQSFDAMRLVAAAGVVWVHSIGYDDGAWGHIGRCGTAFFSLVLVLFIFRAAHKAHSLSYADYAAKRFRRLMVPFLLWTVIYFVLLTIKHQAMGKGWYTPTGGQMMAGTGMQLWFLPFAMVVSLVGYPIAVACLRLDRAAAIRVGWGCAVAGLLFACLPDRNFESLGSYGYLPERSWESVPCLFWGISVETWLRYRGREDHGWLLLILGLALLAGASASYFVWGFTMLAKSVGGLGLVLAAIAAVRSRVLDVFGRVGRLSFGVFLLHPCILVALNMLIPKGVFTSLMNDVILFIYAFLFSLAGAWLLSRWSRTAWTIR